METTSIRFVYCNENPGIDDWLAGISWRVVSKLLIRADFGKVLQSIQQFWALPCALE
jgi:hypothetical protein